MADEPRHETSPGATGCLNFDHVTFWVSNAKQTATMYCVQFGFRPLAYKGLETGSRHVCAHAVRQGNIILVFASALTPDHNLEMGQHLVKHGDGVKDIALSVDDLDAVFKQAVERGATVVKDIWTESDSQGTVRMATVQTLGDTTHTFVERAHYKGQFLPTFKESNLKVTLLDRLPDPNLQFIDHIVGTQIENGLEATGQWYEQNLNFHRFWSVDDVDVKTVNSALKFVVVANETETIKMNILEPRAGKNKSQVQEFNEYYGGPGIQHIALHTDNIVDTIGSLRDRGLEFLSVPATYYKVLRERLPKSKVTVGESLDDLERLQILLDFDEQGYLLQLFTKPMQDRPTLFFEVIQRRNHNGFGAGNFKALFEAVEMEQKARGNLN